MNDKLKAQFNDIEKSVQDQVNSTWISLRHEANKRIFDLGYDAACREFKVGKYAQ